MGQDQLKRISSSDSRIASAQPNDLWESEKSVRKDAAKGLGGNRFTAVFLSWYASVGVFILHLISLESVIAIALCVYLTIYAFERIEDSETFDGSAMNWVLLSFAVITPMSSSISMAFSRREAALNHMALIKATLVNIYSAHACWDWGRAGKVGRRADFDWLDHTDKVLQVTLQMVSELRRLLTLPGFSRARHRVTRAGKKEAKQIEDVANDLHLSIIKRMAVLTDLCEVFKFEGLPPNEATRVRQWERMVAEKIEMLLVIKRYRTPQALRSFARLFTVFLPPFYAPFYGQMAKDLNSLGMGIAFSVLTSIALTSLFQCINAMEDPFIGNLALDSIDVKKELDDRLEEQLLILRKHQFKSAEPFKSPYEAVDEA